MRRMVGNLLVVASVLLVAVAVLGTVAEIAGFRRDSNEDQQLAFVAGLLFSGVLFVLGVILLLAGRYLRRPVPAESGTVAVSPRGGHRGAFAIYLVGSVAVALSVPLLPVAPESLRPLWCLVGQPSLFAQILFGGLLGIRLTGGLGTQGIILTTSLLYFLALFYPPYRMLTIDRASEAVRYRRMLVLLILLGSVHLLLAAVFALLVRA